MTNEMDQRENSINNENHHQEDASKEETQDHEELQENQPIEAEGDELNQWVREISGEHDLQEQDIVESLEDIPVSKGDLPDWINELSPSDHETLDSETGTLANQEQQETIEIESKEDSWDAEESDEDPLDDLDEGFLEISEIDLERDKVEESETSSSDAIVEEQEELPDWLEDMITDQQEPSTLHDEKEDEEERLFMNDEPTQPVQIIEENLSSVDQDQEQDITAAEPSLALDEIEIKESESQIEEVIHIVDFDEGMTDEEPVPDEDFSPISDEEGVDISGVEEGEKQNEEEQEDQDIIFGEEDWELEDQEPVEIPKTLRFAKYLLDQKEIDPAYKIFKTHINKSDHLEEIKAWITEAIDQKDLSKSNLWELLGDIAIKENEHAEALSAYTRSISILLNDL